MAHETAVHLWDARAAGGRGEAIDAVLAADGADEFLFDLLPVVLGRGAVEALRGTFHVHCTDTPGEWTVDFSGPEAVVSRDHTKADAAVRGPASALDLWLWNRVEPAPSGLETFGDPALVEAMGRVRL